MVNMFSMNACRPMFVQRMACLRLMSLLIHFAIAWVVFQLSAAVPGITSEPADASRLVGENTSFSVVVSNTTGAGYQWYLENSPLSSRTNATLTIVGL